MLAPLPTAEPEDDLASYGERFERMVRDTLGVHIKGTEKFEVTEDRVFVGSSRAIRQRA